MAVGLAGAFPVLPTPFRADGAVDEHGFRRVIGWLLDCGVDGLVFPGLASEYEQLTLAERERLIAVAGALAAGRAAFVVGASDADPAQSRALLEAGARAGAAAAMVMTPRHLGGDPDELARHYAGLSEAAPIPIMLQNVPAPMGLDLSSDAVVELVGRTPGIAYVKEETLPCGHRITALLDCRPHGLLGVFGGAGGRYIVDELTRGAVGTMPAAELPELHVALLAAHRAGEADRMRMLYERMLPILMMQAVFRWRLTKEVLRRRGLIADAHTRAPGPALDRRDQAELGAMLHRLRDLTGPIGAGEVGE